MNPSIQYAEPATLSSGTVLHDLGFQCMLGDDHSSWIAREGLCHKYIYPIILDFVQHEHSDVADIYDLVQY